MLRGREVRTLSGGLSRTGLEVRDAGDSLRIMGYACVTNVSYDMGGFKETVRRGAFEKTLAGRPDVQLLCEHQGLPLARTTNGSLTLSEDGRGLRFDASMDKSDPVSALLKSKIGSGLLDQCSFAFRVVRQKWSDDYTDREIQEVSMDRGDVSVVGYGASPTTSVSNLGQIEQNAAPLSLFQARAFALSLRGKK
jgi:HK97 family phage prohead protease